MQVDYEYMGQCLADAGVDVGASGAHGLLCGLICAGETDTWQQLSGEWFPVERAGDPAVDACKSAVNELVLAIHACIDGVDFGFPVLLPDDDAPLQHRVIAVRDWCEGFLYGIGLAAATNKNGLPDQIKETLNDLTEISRMDVDGVSGDEVEEVALAEVTEFIWVAAMLVHDEMALERQERPEE